MTRKRAEGTVARDKAQIFFGIGYLLDSLDVVLPPLVGRRDVEHDELVDALLLVPRQREAVKVMILRRSG